MVSRVNIFKHGTWFEKGISHFVSKNGKEDFVRKEKIDRLKDNIAVHYI